MIIDKRDIKFHFIRSSGPGGQNVNKVATAVQLRFDIGNSRSLSASARDKLMKLAGNRITSDGILIIDARKYRTQEGNKQDALDRLKALMIKAAAKEKKRVATKPTLASKLKRLDQKRIRSLRKSSRSRPKISE